MSVTDALATGVPVVLAPDDGIEAVFEEGACITNEVKKGDWLDQFVENTVKMLKNEYYGGGINWSDAWSQGGKDWAKPYTFKAQCDSFLKMLEVLI